MRELGSAMRQSAWGTDSGCKVDDVHLKLCGAADADADGEEDVFEEDRHSCPAMHHRGGQSITPNGAFGCVHLSILRAGGRMCLHAAAHAARRGAQRNAHARYCPAHVGVMGLCVS